MPAELKDSSAMNAFRTFIKLMILNDLCFAFVVCYIVLLNVNRAQLPVIKLNNTGTANVLYNYACQSIFESTLF